MNSIEFAHPRILLLLLLIIPAVIWYIFKLRSASSIQVSTTKPFDKIRLPFRYIIFHILFGLRLIVMAFLIIALARPQSSNSWENVSTQGIDIVIAIDISSSMLAQDLRPDRLEAAKDVAIEFISGRPYDRIGLILFSSESFTQCPLTTDHAVLTNLFKDVQSGIIEDGTAIGVGLANAVNRLKDSDAVSKVIILLTDGVNNTGVVDPITAGELAKTFGIRVYTIGLGTQGSAPYPAKDMFGRTHLMQVEVEIDEEILQQISDITGGKYFRAFDNNKLRQIYTEIDQMEKSKLNVKEFSRKNEEYMPYALAAFIILLLEFVIRRLIIRSLP
jgi:Ca-activated chloride channel homolog